MKFPVHIAAVLLCAAVALTPLSRAFAQTDPAGAGGDAPDFDVDPVKSAYEFGRYQDALEKAQARIDRGNLTDDQLAALHKYAGLSAFNLNDLERAERHFSALLRVDPDFNLDPFSVSPAAISYFENLKKKLDPQLEVIRQQRRLEAERQRREAEDRARRIREDEERRRRLEELSRKVTVRTVEKHNFLLNFVPFGAGQFEQGRTTTGVVLAATEGAFALTSIIAYLAYDGILQKQQITIDTPTGPQTITRVGIPPNRVAEANNWRLVKYASAGAFYATYGYGVVDAIYHYDDQTVTTTTERLSLEPTIPQRSPPPSRAPAAPEKKSTPSEKHDPVPLGPSVTGSASLQPLAPHYSLFPMPGGLGAGVTLQF